VGLTTEVDQALEQIQQEVTLDKVLDEIETAMLCEAYASWSRRASLIRP